MEVAYLNKLKYKVVLLLTKLIPFLAALCYLLNTILSYIGIDIPLFSLIGGMSILPYCGFTYSNINRNKSIIGITNTTNATEFVNSFVHEIFHLTNHIARKYNISFDSEKVCYIAGDISQKMFKRCHSLMCDCCKNK